MDKIPLDIFFENYDEIKLRKVINELHYFHFKNGSWNQRYAEELDSFITILKFDYFSEVFDFLQNKLKILLKENLNNQNFNDYFEMIQTQLNENKEEQILTIENYFNLKIQVPIQSPKLDDNLIEHIKNLEKTFKESKVKINSNRLCMNPNIISKYIYPEIYCKDVI